MADDKKAAAEAQPEKPDLDQGPNPAVAAQPPKNPGWSQPEYSPGADPHNDGSDYAEPSKEYGPNPAVDAQPGVEAAQSEPQFAEYPPGHDPHGESVPSGGKDPGPAQTRDKGPEPEKADHSTARKPSDEAKEAKDEAKAAERRATEHRSAGGKAGGRA